MAVFYTESNPPDLPPGASPLVINCDFSIGTVGIRDGLQNTFNFANFFSEKLPQFVASIAGPFAPNETAWSNPGNVKLNSIGQYAVATLNPSVSTPGGFFDKAASANGSVSPIAIALTPAISGEFGIFVGTLGLSGPPGTLVPAGWTAIFDNGVQAISTKLASDASPVNISLPISAQDWAVCLSLFGSTTTPVVVQTRVFTATFNGGTVGGSAAFGSNVSPGSALVAFYSNRGSSLNRTPAVTGDSLGNTWQTAAGTQIGAVNSATQTFIMFAQNAALVSSPCTLTLNLPSSVSGSVLFIMEISGLAAIQSNNVSQILQTLNYGFSIPSTVSILGFQVELSGHQTNLNADCILTVTPGTLGAQSKVVQLGLADGVTDAGTPLDNWGLTLTPSLFNDPNFTINITASAFAGSAVTFDLYAVQAKVWLTSNPPPSINYLKSFGQTSGDVLNLFLGSDGVMYQEDVTNAENSLTGVYTAIEPDSFAQSCTQSDREFIAISNLMHGTDIPYSYNGINFDRLSQVGPGAPPSCSTTSAANTILTITQPTAKSEITHPGQLSGILWSAGPGSSSPGNVVTVYYALQTDQVADPDLVPGVGVVLAGVDSGGPNNNFNGHPLNGNYVVTSIGSGVPPGAQFVRWFFTIQVTINQFVNQANHEEGHGPTGSYRVTLATLTTASQVPNLEVGNQFSIAGTGGSPPAGFDGPWVITATPNASQMQITSVSRTSNVATYSFNLITGTNPAVGQFVTVTQTLTANGAFNVTNVAISSTSPGTFSIPLPGPNQSSSAETGSGIIFGTIFQFDPMQVVGNKVGGTIQTVGIIGAGTRKCCYSFLTRDGYITQPSPITTFTVPSGASNLVVSNLLTGPSNVVARIIHLTAADGGNFYNIFQPVSVIDNGVTVINSSTWVKDNTSMSATLSFSDAVLLAATQIDIQGNNLFETAELGSSLGFIPYASRIFAIDEQDKVTNFLNWSFDGGVVGGIPAGWTADVTNGGGASVINSPIFGFAYSITNSTGITKAIYGMISQNAFQDEFNVPIIQASTLYSVRITAAVPTGATTGQIVVDLFSASIGQALGTFTLQLSALATTMQIFTGTMLTTELAPVPNDLVLRLYATNILNGVQITVDRVEPFPTDGPDLNTIVTGSYINNFEAFDQITGVISGAVQNQQPIRSAFELFDVLYLVKTKSYVAIRNVDGLEPVFWGTPRTGSQAVGTPSIYGVTSGIDTPNAGEEWAIIAGEAGAFIFNGGEPIKLSEEIQQFWNQINWRYGHTLWVQNDIVNRRILFGVPVKTPNTWLPTGIIPDDSNPTTPNVVLELNYKQLTSAGALAHGEGVHPTYSGKLLSTDYTRKWSVWPISVPAAALITRSDTTSPIMFGNSKHTGKIYHLVAGQLNDDGAAIYQRYITYGFPSVEQEQALGIGGVRKTFEFMTAILDGAGSVSITALPNTLTTPYPSPLLPDITLPGSINGDTEVPMNVTGQRCFFDYLSNAVGSGFELSRMMVAMRQDPWSPIRGSND